MAGEARQDYRQWHEESKGQFYKQLEDDLDREIEEYKKKYGESKNVLIALKETVLNSLEEEGALDDLVVTQEDLLSIYANHEIKTLCAELGIKSFYEFLYLIKIIDDYEQVPTEFAGGIREFEVNGIKVPVILPTAINRKQILAIERLLEKIKKHPELHQYFNSNSKIFVKQGFLRFELTERNKKQSYMVTQLNFFKIEYEPSEENIKKYIDIRNQRFTLLERFNDIEIKDKAFKKIVEKSRAEKRKLFDKLRSAEKKLKEAKAEGDGVEIVQARQEFIEAKKESEKENRDFYSKSLKAAASELPRYSKLQQEYESLKAEESEMTKNILPLKLIDIETGKSVKSEYGSAVWGDFGYCIDEKCYTFTDLNDYFISWDDDEKTINERRNENGKLLEKTTGTFEGPVFEEFYDDDSKKEETYLFESGTIIQTFYTSRGRIKEKWIMDFNDGVYKEGEVFDDEGKKVKNFKLLENGKNYIWEYFDTNDGLIKRTGNYFDEEDGTEGDFIQIFENGKPAYTTFYDKKRSYSAVMYRDDSKRFGLYDKREHPNKEDYLNMLATELNTPEKLSLFFDLFFEYKYDDEREFHAYLTKGTDDLWQSPNETIERIYHGVMLGDCEDLAIFAAEILKRQGKNAHVIIVPSHAICVWSIPRSDGKFDLYSLDTSGLNKVLGVSSIIDGLNSLIAGIGIYSISEQIEIGLIDSNGNDIREIMPTEVIINEKLYNELIKARKSLKEGNFEEAKTIYEQLCENYPKSTLLKEEKEKVVKLSNRNYISDCEKGLEGGGISFDKCKDVDEYYENKHMDKERLSWNLRLMKHFPTEPFPYLVLAYLYYWNKDFKNYLKILDKALNNLSEEKKSIFFKYKIGFFLNKNDPKKVLEIYQQGKSHLDGRFKYQVANYLERNGQTKVATEIYAELIFGFEIRKANPLNLALALISDTDYAPAFPGAYVKYAQYLYNKKDFNTAKKIIEIGLKYYKKDKNLLRLKDRIEGKNELDVERKRKIKKLGHN